MVSDEINKVVDKMAEKLSLAVDKVEPIAREVIDQVQNRALLQGCLFGTAMLFIFIFIILINMKTQDTLTNDEEGGRLVITGLLIVIFLIFLICAINSFSTYVSPLATILGV